MWSRLYIYFFVWHTNLGCSICMISLIVLFSFWIDSERKICANSDIWYHISLTWFLGAYNEWTNRHQKFSKILSLNRQSFVNKSFNIMFFLEKLIFHYQIRRVTECHGRLWPNVGYAMSTTAYSLRSHYTGNWASVIFGQFIFVQIRIPIKLKS